MRKGFLRGMMSLLLSPLIAQAHLCKVPVYHGITTDHEKEVEACIDVNGEFVYSYRLIGSNKDIDGITVPTRYVYYNQLLTARELIIYSEDGAIGRNIGLGRDNHDKLFSNVEITDKNGYVTTINMDPKTVKTNISSQLLDLGVQPLPED